MSKTKKEQVFEAAAELFMEKGYLATSMRELAKRVGLEQASSLYNHLGSKEEVLIKICFENAEKFLEGMTIIENTVTSPVEKLQALIRLHINIAIQDSNSITVFNDEWRHLSEPFLSDFLKKRKDYEARFKRIIETGIEGNFFKNVDSTIALYTILTSIRWIHYWYKPGRELSVKKMENDIFSILLSGLKK